MRVLTLALLLALSPAVAAPVPFARPPKAAPSLAGTWWVPREGCTFECHFHEDGKSYARIWDAAGPTSGWYVGCWEPSDDGTRVTVHEHLVGPCGRRCDWMVIWSADVPELHRDRPVPAPR